MGRWLAVSLLLMGVALGARAQTVVCFGDSLTAGYGAPEGQAYPDFLRQDLAAAGVPATVIKAGVDGQTTADALGRLPEVVRDRPTVVAVELGVNDALRGIPSEETERNLRTIVKALRKSGARVVLAGLDGRKDSGAPLPPALRTEAIQDFWRINAEVARQYRLPEIPFLLKGVYGVPEKMSPDGMHPNGAGYEVVARTVLPYVERALRKP